MEARVPVYDDALVLGDGGDVVAADLDGGGLAVVRVRGNEHPVPGGWPSYDPQPREVNHNPLNAEADRGRIQGRGEQGGGGPGPDVDMEVPGVKENQKEGVSCFSTTFQI